MSDWINELASAALDGDHRYGHVLELSRDDRGRDVDLASLREVLVARFRQQPALVRAWQLYSADKRWSPSPYLEGLEVGLYDSGYRDVEQHVDEPNACAAFVVRELDWLRVRHPEADR